MPRKRMLDPSVWDDPDIAQLTPIERLLFIAMVNLADDYGHLAGHPALLRKWVFGYDDFSTADVKAMRDHILICCRNVALYSVSGQEYIWLKTWERHQDLRYRAKAQYPCHACGQYHEQGDYKECPGREIEIHEPPQPLRISAQELTHNDAPDYVTLDQEKKSHDELSKNHDQTAPNGADTLKGKPRKKPSGNGEEEHAFEQFWFAYPRKVNRAEAQKVYAQMLKNKVEPESLLRAAQNYAKESELVGRAKEYICHATTFLRQRRFEDYQQAPDQDEFTPQGPMRGSSRASPSKLQQSEVAISEAFAKMQEGGSYFGEAESTEGN